MDSYVFTASWTRASEKLPDTHGHYLVSVVCEDENDPLFDNGWIQIAYYWDHKFHCGHGDGNFRVTHWMPLPKPIRDTEV